MKILAFLTKQSPTNLYYLEIIFFQWVFRFKWAIKPGLHMAKWNQTCMSRNQEPHFCHWVPPQHFYQHIFVLTHLKVLINLTQGRRFLSGFLRQLHSYKFKGSFEAGSKNGFILIYQEFRNDRLCSAQNQLTRALQSSCSSECLSH